MQQKCHQIQIDTILHVTIWNITNWASTQTLQVINWKAQSQIMCELCISKTLR